MSKKFFAVFRTSCGLTSWATSHTIDEAVQACARIALADWAEMLGLKGRVVPINVFDVSGSKGVSFDDVGLVVADGEPVEVLEVHAVTLK